MKLNDKVQHEEIRGTRGFTGHGDDAGTNSVLAGNGRGWRFGNPWIDAPIHLSQVYNPALRSTGATDNDGHSCMSTWRGMDFDTIAPGDRVWTFPVDGGIAPHEQLAAESPYLPQEKVGIDNWAHTGPYLYVWTQSLETGPQVLGYDPLTGEQIWSEGEFKAALGRLVSGSLVGPGGKPVKVKVIDDEDVDGYVGEGNGWLLPVKPLKPGATYKATVVLAPRLGNEQRQVTHSWTFKASSAELRFDGYRYPLSRKQRKSCSKRKRGHKPLICFIGPKPSPTLR